MKSPEPDRDPSERLSLDDKPRYDRPRDNDRETDNSVFTLKPNDGKRLEV
ncbi:hypothetical protein V0288_13465 [Pannus brasiliensis CCIBt3594]|uniref:Uncharacterized protein n=1 Tax=Pannus brasiliensis CCIBt3594 TaxID=1427578 RepID=A0AAW9QTE7_9CHRO